MKILSALIKKELHQIVRDPSSILIAFVLPLMLLLIYMYGINMDTVKVKMGIYNQDLAPEVSTLIASFNENDYMRAYHYEDKAKMYRDLSGSIINGIVVIPNDFSTKLSRGQSADMQIITDGAEVNLSNYAKAYPSAIANQWLASSKFAPAPPLINTDTRFWYNQDINSHYFILPGSLAITMTLIGMLLTALVVAREWERGTMEALLTTKVRKIELVLGKYIPYFVLGMLSMAFSVFMCVAVFGIPFKGSYFVLFGVCALFLFSALGFGLLISTNLKDQFLASQAALAVGFLPSLLLSGLMFPINSMPEIIQHFTKIIPARYFVSFIQSEFMTGTVYEIVLENSLFLLILGIVLFAAIMKKTQMRLD